MIPRYQRILFWTLVAGIALMSLFLLRGCRQAHRRLTAIDNATPISAPTSAAPEDVTLYLASDADDSITATTAQLALPQDPTHRARTLLQHLLAEYALPNSPHSLQSGPSVDDVFLLDLPATVPTFGNTSSPRQQAIINLHGSFVENHPSGVAVEDLTIRSIIGTLHSALPNVITISFLVDGQTRDNLAGHADLSHPYPAIDTAYKPAPSDLPAPAPPPATKPAIKPTAPAATKPVPPATKSATSPTTPSAIKPVTPPITKPATPPPAKPSPKPQDPAQP